MKSLIAKISIDIQEESKQKQTDKRLASAIYKQKKVEQDLRLAYSSLRKDLTKAWKIYLSSDGGKTRFQAN